MFTLILSKMLNKYVLSIVVLTTLLVSSLVLYPAPTVRADTSVGGTISEDTTWDISNSPYLVNDNTIISSGVVLTIEPGVTVKFLRVKYISVYGTLNAIGTPDNGITFTGSSSVGEWGGIGFSSGSIGNFEYCTIEEADYVSSTSGVGIGQGSSVSINHCTIHKNGVGIRVTSNNNISVFNNNILNNNQGVRFVNCISPSIAPSNIIDGNSYGIAFYNCSSLGTIDNLTLTGNGYAFYISDSGHFTLGPNNTITANTYPLALSGNSFPSADSVIPAEGNTNNAITAEGTIEEAATWWLFSGINYVISDDIIISNLASLTIEPGVTVKFARSKGMSVYGTLNAVGTLDNGITFTGSSSLGEWNGIGFSSGSTGNLKYCTVEEADYGDSTAGVGVGQGSSVSINHCTIQNNRTGIRVTNNNNISVIDNNILDNNEGVRFVNCVSPSIAPSNIIDGNSDGIAFYNCSSLGTIDNLTLTGNGNAFYIRDSGDFTLGPNNLLTDNAYPLALSGNSFPSADSVIPAEGNTNNAIRAEGTIEEAATWWLFSGIDYVINDLVIGASSSLTVEPGVTMKFLRSNGMTVYGILNAVGTPDNRITFTGSSSVGEWGGIGFSSGSIGNLEYCTIEEADYLSSTSGVGIGQGSSVSINHCTIQNNGVGIRVNNNNNTIITNSNILDNDLFGVVSIGPSIINAENNWWGDPSGPYHATDNPFGLGDKVSDYVDFVPWLTEPFVPPETRAPLASFTYSIDSMRVTLISTSSDQDNDIVSYDWDLGDGNTSNKQYIEHSYVEYGLYLITLTVTDSTGLSDSITQYIEITSDPFNSENHLNTIFEFAGYGNSLSTYASSIQDEIQQLTDPTLRNEVKEDLVNSIASLFPVLNIALNPLESFESYLSNLINENRILTFTRTNEGTLINDNGHITLIEGIHIPFEEIDEIRLSPAYPRCVLEFKSGGATEFQIQLEPLNDIFNRGVNVIYYAAILGFDITAQFSVFSGYSINPLIKVVGINGLLIIQNDDYIFTISLNDPLSLKGAEVGAGIYISTDLSVHPGVGGKVNLDVGVFIKAKPEDVVNDIIDVLSTELGDRGQDETEVLDAMELGLDVLEGVASVLANDTNVGLEVGISGGLGLGAGASVLKIGEDPSIDLMGSVSGIIYMPVDTFTQVLIVKNNIPILVNAYYGVASELQDIDSKWDLLFKAPRIARAFWTAYSTAQKIREQVDEEVQENTVLRREGGLGIEGSVKEGLGIEAGGQLYGGYETNLETLISLITFDFSKVFQEGYFGYTFGETFSVSAGVPLVDGKVSLSKDIFRVEARGKGGMSYPAGGFQLQLLEFGPSDNITVVTDYGVDNDTNGLFDNLTVDMEFNTQTPGEYVFEGMLFKDDLCIGTSQESLVLEAGTHPISLLFEGLNLRNSQSDGPYEFGIAIARSSDQDVLYTDLSLYNTSAYSYTDFETSSLVIQNIQGQGIDTDQNGLYENLQLSISLESATETNVVVEAVLYGNNFSLGTETSQNIAIGANDIMLLFDGQEISKSGLNEQTAAVFVYDLNDTLLATGEVDVNIPYSDYEIDKANLSDEYTDTGVDADGDGGYNYLEVGIGVDVVEAGEYTVDAYLVAGDTSFYVENTAYLDTGENVLSLTVDGQLIRDTAMNQNYTLTNLRLLYDEMIYATRSSPYTTSVYDYEDFDMPEIALSNEFSDEAIDDDSDGLYDYLEINVGLVVTETDLYRVSGYLKCGETYLYREIYSELAPDDDQTELRFNGGDIHNEGVDGPYELERVSLTKGEEQIFQMTGTYNTSAYDYTAFEPSNQQPVASLSYSPLTLFTNQDCVFSGLDSYDTDGNIISWGWDFGDGNTGSGEELSHSYTDNGTYTVTLTVIDNDGGRGSTNLTVTVNSVSGVAETTIFMEKDADGIVVISMNVTRIKDPATGLTADIPGGIGAFTASAAVTPEMGIEFLEVRPFGIVPDPVTGIFSGVLSPPGDPPVTLAKLVSILSCNCTTPHTLTIEVLDITAAGGPSIHVMEEHPNSILFLRGDANDNGSVTITDAMNIAQYIVGKKTLEEINALNAASVKQDNGGAKIDILDALYIAQYIVKKRDAYFNLK